MARPLAMDKRHGQKADSLAAVISFFVHSLNGWFLAWQLGLSAPVAMTFVIVVLAFFIRIIISGRLLCRYGSVRPAVS